MSSKESDLRGRLDGSGRPAWLTDLGLDCYSLTVVRGLDERRALKRIGVPPRQIRPVTLDAAAQTVGDHSLLWNLVCQGSSNSPVVVAVAAGFGDWTLVVEEDGWTATEPVAVADLSRGTEAASCFVDINADTWFTYAVEGQVLYTDEEIPGDGGDGTEPMALLSALAAVGADNLLDGGDQDDHGRPERAVCALAGLRLSAADFRDRPMLAAPRG
jgi:hypothetical protein